MRTRPACLLLASLLSAATAGAAPPLPDLVQYVNPFCGTTHDGGLFPGATAPFGMIQWSPDSGKRATLAGYDYRDSTIDGFSLDHLSGGGSLYAGNFAFMPLPAADGLAAAPGNRYGFNTPFSHANETAHPGYYAVTLDNGLKIELTATARTGFGRFTFPATNSAGTLIINAGSNITGTTNATVQIDPAAQAIMGSATGGHFLGHPNVCTTYFYAVFDHPFARCGVWSDLKLSRDQTAGAGKTAGAYVVFDTRQTPTILAKAAISYVSIAGAKANLAAENPPATFNSADFEHTSDTTGAMWNSWLNRIQVTGGTLRERQTFYSMLYHALLAPTICSDANGRYLGYDGLVHTTEKGRVQYGSFSGWDIYRSECQLLAMIAPQAAGDMAQSLLLDYQQGGAFPRWGLATEDSGVMDGDPAAPIIAGFHAFGATNFDAPAALAGLIRAATDPTVRSRTHIAERDGLADYLNLGYVPEDQHGIWGAYGNVSMTLEYASADFAVSQLAAALGDPADATKLLRQARNWRNLYNPATGCLQMRRRDGSWAPGFANNVLGYDHNRAYQEGTAAQYVWLVPFNLQGLTEVLGGRAAAAARLDTFFTELNAGMSSPHAYLGNEPCLATPWIYCFLGQPAKTQRIVRQALTELYSPDPAGYPGNDDLGELSSWYVFAALGMYPELPGSDILVLHGPLFPKAVLRLPNGNLTLAARGAAAESPYVQSLTVNDRNWNQPWLKFNDLAQGSTLKYMLSSSPNHDWGISPEAAPPSYP